MLAYTGLGRLQEAISKLEQIALERRNLPNLSVQAREEVFPETVS